MIADKESGGSEHDRLDLADVEDVSHSEDERQAEGYESVHAAHR